MNATHASSQASNPGLLFPCERRGMEPCKKNQRGREKELMQKEGRQRPGGYTVKHRGEFRGDREPRRQIPPM